MMTGFQAEENLTGRAPKNVRKILDVIKKKTPEHCLLDGVFEKSLAAAYFPT